MYGSILCDKRYIMGDDLYSPTSQPAAVPQSSENVSWFDFGVSIDLASLLYWLNVIVLAWTLFYSIIFVVEFFFYRVKYPDGELVAREKKGVQAIFLAAGMWWGYLFCIILYTVFLLQPAGLFRDILGWVAVAAYVLKVMVADMPNIPVIGGFLGKPGDAVQGFVENLSKNTQAVLGSLVDAVMEIFSPSS
jgi:hypothetical protein